MKLPIEIERFRKLDLRVGSVLAIRRHPVLADLSIVTVELDPAVDALVPSSSIRRLELGSQVIVARALHPLSTADLRLTACLVATSGADGLSVPVVSAELPGGSRLS
jgi:hypothetical protein